MIRVAVVGLPDLGMVLNSHPDLDVQDYPYGSAVGPTLGKVLRGKQPDQVVFVFADDGSDQIADMVSALEKLPRPPVVIEGLDGKVRGRFPSAATVQVPFKVNDVVAAIDGALPPVEGGDEVIEATVEVVEPEVPEPEARVVESPAPWEAGGSDEAGWAGPGPEEAPWVAPQAPAPGASAPQPTPEVAAPVVADAPARWADAVPADPVTLPEPVAEDAPPWAIGPASTPAEAAPPDPVVHADPAPTMPPSDEKPAWATPTVVTPTDDAPPWAEPAAGTPSAPPPSHAAVGEPGSTPTFATPTADDAPPWAESAAPVAPSPTSAPSDAPAGPVANEVPPWAGSPTPQTTTVAAEDTPPWADTPTEAIVPPPTVAEPTREPVPAAVPADEPPPWAEPLELVEPDPTNTGRTDDYDGPVTLAPVDTTPVEPAPPGTPLAADEPPPWAEPAPSGAPSVDQSHVAAVEDTPPWVSDPQPPVVEDVPAPVPAHDQPWADSPVAEAVAESVDPTEDLQRLHRPDSHAAHDAATVGSASVSPAPVPTEDQSAETPMTDTPPWVAAPPAPAPEPPTPGTQTPPWVAAPAPTPAPAPSPAAPVAQPPMEQRVLEQPFTETPPWEAAGAPIAIEELASSRADTPRAEPPWAAAPPTTSQQWAAPAVPPTPAPMQMPTAPPTDPPAAPAPAAPQPTSPTPAPARMPEWATTSPAGPALAPPPVEEQVTFAQAPYADQADLTAGRSRTRLGKVLAVVAAKGGVGKSTMSLWATEAIGAALREQGRRCALVDGNIGQPDISKMMRMWGQTPDLGHIADGRRFTTDELHQTLVEVPELNASVLFGPKSPIKVSEEAALRALSSAVRLMRREFSWIVIDAPVGTIFEDVYRDFILHEADLLLVVVNPHEPTLQDTASFLSEISQPVQLGGMAYPTDKAAIVLNKSNHRSGLSLDDIERRLPEYRVIGEIPEVESVLPAVNDGIYRAPTAAAAVIGEIVANVTGEYLRVDHTHDDAPKEKGGWAARLKRFVSR